MGKEALLQKLLELAERGVGGEAENAKEMARMIMEKYNLDGNEYHKIATPKLNRAKRQLMAVAAKMCGCCLFKSGYNYMMIGKQTGLALDCYYYLCGCIPKEHRKDSQYIYGFTMALEERLAVESGWVDTNQEYQLIEETLGLISKARRVGVNMSGYDKGKEISLNRQAGHKTKYLR